MRYTPFHDHLPVPNTSANSLAACRWNVLTNIKQTQSNPPKNPSGALKMRFTSRKPPSNLAEQTHCPPSALCPTFQNQYDPSNLWEQADMSQPASTIPLQPLDDSLQAVLTSSQLGFVPKSLWNPSPSAQHRTDPYALPMSLRIGLQGSPETGAKFSPPPYAVVIESGDQRVLLAVAAQDGWHRWNDLYVSADADRVTLKLDLEGMTDPAEAASHVSLHLIPADKGESRHALLARGLARLYPAAYVPAKTPPAWWHQPIYCGWGDQVTMAMHLEGVGPERRAMAYCTQGLYERWINRLDEAGVPFGTIIIDHGWSPAGVWRPDLTRFPDLRGFIDRQHQRGRRVLLWLATWLWDGLDDDLCIFAGDHKLTADPTNPAYIERIQKWVHDLISPDGFDADGFKIDQLGFSPSYRRPRGGPCFGHTLRFEEPQGPIRMHGDNFGTELLHQLQKTIYQSAKAAKSDALITSSTVHPYFHDTLDMVRLHDMGHVAPDIFDAMEARAQLSRAALPGKLIDTDDWVHTNYDMWLRYTSGSRRIGVPCIFYAEHFMLNWKAEPATKLIPIEDLKRIAQAWRSDAITE
jgi:hypothetical protein